MTEPALELRGLFAGYSGSTVLRDVSLRVPPRGVVAVLGPNGAGKTTALRVCSGVVAPSRGAVLVDGEDLSGASPSEFVQKGICCIPDPRGIFRSLTVRENLLLQAPRGEAKKGIDLAVEAFPRLGERLHQTAGTLSGGEQQMLAVSRAYVQEPTVVLLDEVSMGLAPTLVDEIFSFLERLVARGTALVIVEQFIHRALALADTVYVMTRGGLTHLGAADDVDEGQIFNAYAGRNGST